MSAINSPTVYSTSQFASLTQSYRNNGFRQGAVLSSTGANTGTGSSAVYIPAGSYSSSSSGTYSSSGQRLGTYTSSGTSTSTASGKQGAVLQSKTSTYTNTGSTSSSKVTGSSGSGGSVSGTCATC